MSHMDIIAVLHFDHLESLGHAETGAVGDLECFRESFSDFEGKSMPF